MTLSASLPYLLITGAGVVWGSTFSLTLIATADGTHPLVLAAVQVIVSSALFYAICRLTGSPAFRTRNMHYYAVLAVLGISAPNLLYYNAAPSLSAGILSITISTVPMLTYAITWVMGIEGFDLKRMTGILFGLVAIVLLVVPDLGLSASDASFWTLVVLLCALCYAVENVYISEGIDPAVTVQELLFGSNLLASVLLTGLVYASGLRIEPAWLVTTSGWAIIAIAGTSAVAYLMFFSSIKLSGPVFASQCSYLVTLSGVLWGIALFGETHSYWVWISVAVMMAGLFLVTPKDRQRPIPVPLETIPAPISGDD